MKKVLLAGGVVVVLGAAALVGGAAYTGNRTQARMQAGIAQLQAWWPSVKVVEDHYERNLFSATHTLTLSLGCPARPADGGGSAPAASLATRMKGSLLLTLKERIQHGPLPGFSNIGAASIETELIGAPASATLAWGSDKQPPLTARTLVGLTGGYSSHIEVAPGQFAEPSGARMEWQAISADVKASSTDVSRPWSYQLDSPGMRLQIVDDKVALQMQMGAIQSRGDVDAGGSMWLRTGKAQGGIASVEMTMRPRGEAKSLPAAFSNVSMKLAKLAFTSEATRDNADLVTSSASLSGEGQVADTRLDKFEIQASVKRLHAPSYAALIDHLMTSPCDLTTAGTSTAERFAHLQEDALHLLPHNPEYSLDKLAVEIAGQRGEVSYAFGIEGVTAADMHAPLPLLMAKVKASGKATLPRDWVTKALDSAGERFGAKGNATSRAEMMNLMLEQATTHGFVLREGEMLSSSFALAQGRMLVNGKPIGAQPLPAN